jgi:hypothetical protein
MEEIKAKPNKEAFYVDPNKFKQEIKEFYQSSECTVFLGSCLNKIAEGLSYNPKFINYSFKDDMIGDALTKMYSALKRKKFDIKSEASPFNYFTTIAFHAFINRIKREKKHHNALVAYRERKYEELLCSAEGHIYVKPPIDGAEEDPFYD